MKSFKKLLSEVAQPKSEDELNFKAKHEIEMIDHPESEESQHSSTAKKSSNRPADYKKGEDMAVYEAKTDKYHQHMLKALGKSRLPKNHSYTSAIADNGDFVVRDGGGRIVGRIEKGEHDLNEAKKATDYDSYEDYTKANKAKGVQVIPRALWNNLMKDKMKEQAERVDEAKMDPVNKKALKGDWEDREDKDLDNDGDTDQSDIYLHKRRQAVTKAIKKQKDLGENYKMASIGRKLQQMAPKEKNDQIANAMANLGDHLESYGETFGAKNMKELEKKTGMSSKVIQMLIKKAGEMKEEVQLSENFKAGRVELDDGTKVSLKKQDADLLNQMFKDLNATNKKKMMKVAMEDEAGFEEILGFAREAL